MPIEPSDHADTLRHLVDVQVANAKALRQLDADLDAAATRREGRLRLFSREQALAAIAARTREWDETNPWLRSNPRGLEAHLICEASDLIEKADEDHVRRGRREGPLNRQTVLDLAAHCLLVLEVRGR